MQHDEADAIRAVIGEGIAGAVFKLSQLDKDPIRDCRVIARAALSALESAGYSVVR